MKDFISGLFSKDASLSSMRYVFIFSIIISLVPFWTVWTIISVQKVALQDIPSTLWLCLSTILTVATAGKLWQNGQENGPTNDKAGE